MGKARHDLSHDKLFTCDIGELVPCSVVEVLPGDTFRANSSVMVRLSPLAAPVMHGMSIRVHHFFVPHRLSWNEDVAGSSWEDFITGGPDGNDAATVPTLTGTQAGMGSGIGNYLGIPPIAGTVNVNSMPIRAYNMIYNEWYRDQDLCAERTLHANTLANIAYEKDYFSKARPWPQKGTEVTLPLGIAAPIATTAANGSPVTVRKPLSGGAYEQLDSSTATLEATGTAGTSGNQLYADLTQATAATINQLRLASGLQRFAEARARFGSRYAEYVRHAFGARPLDSRIQRPEYLGGSSQRVSVSEIIQSAPDATERAFGVGDMYGHGIGMTKSNRYVRRFDEHGYIMSLFSCRPKAIYANGIERHWLRTDREDYFQKELAHIGQQQIDRAEIYGDATGTVFGWSDRYAEYRQVNSSVAGEFRSTLDYWHLARDFSSAPALNQTFVEVTPADTKRIFNDQTGDSLWVAASHRIQAKRVVPQKATSRLL